MPELPHPADDEDWDETASPLDELVVECLQRASEIGSAALEESCKRHPEFADALRERVSRLAAFGLMPETTTNTPRRIGGFQILREIGKGGMGVVYLAEQTDLHRFVALKILAPGAAFHQKALERFRREALTAAQLNHPGIVKVHAVGEDQGVHWIAMELIAGVSLEKVVEELSKLQDSANDGERLQCLIQCVQTGFDVFQKDLSAQPSFGSDTTSKSDTSIKLDTRSKSDTKSKTMRAVSGIRGRTYVETICRIIASVADTLQFAHEGGVVHRDVKPANVLLRSDLSPVLSDFGLARQESLPGLTKSGEFAGTPYYVSPEQASARSGAVGAPSDIYSLGVTLYELLTLKRPFEGQTSQEVISRVLTEEPPDPRRFRKDLAADLSTILLKTLEKDPARRYESAAALRDDLRAFINFKPIRAVPPSTATRVRKFARRRPLATSLLAGVLLCTIAGGIYYQTLPGELYITSPTEGSTVLIDGVVRGKAGPSTPLLAALPPGIHRLRLEKPDVELASPEEEIVVNRGVRRAVERTLASLRGALRLESKPPGAHVTITPVDGTKKNTTATAPALVDLPAGRHKVIFELAGFGVRETEAVVLPGGIVTPCSVEWNMGTLLLECQQTGVRVELFNGKSCSGTPVQIGSLPRLEPFTLPAGEYSLRAHCVDRATITLDQEHSIVVESDKTVARGIWLPEIVRNFEVQMPGRVYAVIHANFGFSGDKSYVFGTERGRIVAVRSDGTKVFDVDCGGEVRQLLAFDWNNDGIDEIFAMIDGGTIGGYNKNGDSILKTKPVSSGAYILEARNTPVGRTLVSQTLGTEVHLFQEHAEPRMFRASATIDECYITDVDQDGDDDLLLATRKGAVEAWTLDATPTRIFQTQPGTGLNSIVSLWTSSGRVGSIVALSTNDHAYFLDVKGNLVKDVAVADKSRKLRALNLDGSGREGVLVIASRTLQYFTSEGELIGTCSSPENIDPVNTYDIDQDGMLDLMAGTIGSRLLAWKANGTPIFDVNLEAGQIASIESTKTGAGEVLILATTRRGLVVGVDQHGQRVFCSEMRGRAMYSTFTDGDGDGVPEVAVGTWSGHAAVLKVSGRQRFSVEFGADGYCLSDLPKSAMKTGGVLIGGVDGRLSLLDGTGHIAKSHMLGSAVLHLQWTGAEADPYLFAGMSNRQLKCINSKLDLLWSLPLSGQVRKMIPAEFNGDGKSEMAMVLSDGKYMVLDRDGNTLWKIESQSEGAQHLAVGDVDQDGKSEIAVDEGKGSVGLHSANGTKVVRTAKKERDIVAGITMADFNSDGKSDVLVSSSFSTELVDGVGKQMWQIPDTSQMVHLELGDLNVDGKLDITGVCQAEGIYVIDSNGNVRAKRPEKTIILATKVADLDGDGVPDFVTIDAVGRAQRFSADAICVADFRTRDVMRMMECTNLDREGKQEVVACCDGGAIVTLDLATLDPRAALRSLFLEGVVAAESGNDVDAAAKFTKAGVSWLLLDTFGVDQVIKRLECLTHVPSAAAALTTLKRALKSAGR